MRPNGRSTDECNHFPILLDLRQEKKVTHACNSLTRAIFLKDADLPKIPTDADEG
jgi:hypothetical protein